MMTKERKEKWEELITSTDLTHNSHKGKPQCSTNQIKRPILPQSREGTGSVLYRFSEEEYKERTAEKK